MKKRVANIIASKISCTLPAPFLSLAHINGTQTLLTILMHATLKYYLFLINSYIFVVSNAPFRLPRLRNYDYVLM